LEFSNQVSQTGQNFRFEHSLPLDIDQSIFDGLTFSLKVLGQHAISGLQAKHWNLLLVGFSA
jgi:hypothetical protein